MDKGFDVSVWDIKKVLHPKMPQDLTLVVKEKKIKIKYFYKKNKIFEALKELKEDDLIFCLFGCVHNSISIFKIISEKNIQYTLLRNYPGWYVESNGSLLSSILKKIIKPSSIYYYIKLKLLKYFAKINAADYVIVGGQKSYLRDSLIDSSSKIIDTHTTDYDYYLDFKNDNRFIGKDYIVFIDQNLPFHSDVLYTGNKQRVTPQKYFYELETFFKSIENLYGLEVIIAKHPRSNKDQIKKYFSNRKIIESKTINLIQNSKFVISHFSAAINFCVLFNKPFCLIETDEIVNAKILAMEFFSKYFKKNIFNISNKKNIFTDNFLKKNSFIYSEYKNDYIKKSDTPDFHSWETLFKVIEKEQ